MRRLIAGLTALFLLLSILLCSTVITSAAAHRKGDVDLDGEVTILDATVIQRVLVEMIADSDGHILRYGDIDGGGLSIMDVTFIQRYLAQMDDGYPIGDIVDDDPQPTEKPTETEPLVVNGKVTVDGVTFDVSDIPDTLVIDNSESSVSRTLMLIPDRTLEPEDIFIQVNSGSYDYKIDYADDSFKESYLMTKNGKIAHGYDCLVRNEKGEEAAWVAAHYASGMYYPFRANVWGLKCEKCSFPIDFFYKGKLIKRCMVMIDLRTNKTNIESTLTEVRKIEKACWTDSMTDKEKLKAFSEYIEANYSYSKVMCVDGAVYVAFAARDLGLTSMLMYPGGKENPERDHDIVTYNLYYDTIKPGGHCACLVAYPDSSILRYDVQGGSQWIRAYNN